MSLLGKLAAAVADDPSRLYRVFLPSGASKLRNFLTRQKIRQAKERTKQRGEAAFKSSLWQHGEISTRNYATYDDYVAHQRAKLETLPVKATPVELRSRTEHFRQRFGAIPEIRPNSTVLCLAARLGNEVAAMIALGHFAVGLDLNPGEENRYVVQGDFHALQYADASVDCVYCNSLDHAFDIERIAKEVARVLKPGGIFVAEIFRGTEEGSFPRDFESMAWPTSRKLAEKIAQCGNLHLETMRDPAPHGDREWPQFILRKADGENGSCPPPSTRIP